jgi:hypothetical protein
LSCSSAAATPLSSNDSTRRQLSLEEAVGQDLTTVRLCPRRWKCGEANTACAPMRSWAGLFEEREGFVGDLLSCRKLWSWEEIERLGLDKLLMRFLLFRHFARADRRDVGNSDVEGGGK